MSAECSGINYTVRLHEGAVEVRARPFQDSTLTVEIGRIKSIELLRKSVWPPAVVGGIGLSLGLILGLAGGGLIGIVPLSFLIPTRMLSLGLAAVCLIVLTSRWLFANLVLKAADIPAIIVRMVPTDSAKRFVMLVQKQGPISQKA